jgi:hypothetical protein
VTGSSRTTSAEQHLGDHLAALVDGELGHDSRERVLAHLATCAKCKAEADAQRELKTVFAETAPPPPSEGFLARLQGLPGDGDGGGASGPGHPFDGVSRFGDGAFDLRPETSFGYLPAAGPAAAAAAAGSRSGGFRIHEVERPSPRSRRFAFAAAGAVSLAAFALGGALPLEAAVDSPGGRTDAAGAAATPPTAPANADGLLRSAALPGADERPAVFSAPAAQVGSAFPALITHPPSAARPSAAPLLPDGTGLSPLIRQIVPVAQAVPYASGATVERAPTSPAPTQLTAPSGPSDTADRSGPGTAR